VTVRRATRRDKAALVRMACRFIAESSYRGLVTADPSHQERAIDFLLEHGLLLVADIGGGPVGMLGMAIVPSPVSGELVASEVAWWLEPVCRGGTAAVRLWEYAERWAADHDAVYVHMVAPHGTDVGDMYRRRGYLPLETVWQKRVAA
jgi:Acetyltransferase (GNAT) family